MSTSTKRVAVIGAGASGLAAIKSCIEEGLLPLCYERTAHIGGLWHYTSDVNDGQACVMKSTVINSSKEMMCFSDFPIPAHLPNFMHNSKVLEYFHSYTEEFGLRKHIRFNHEIMNITKPDTLEDNKENIDGLESQWLVTVKDKSTGNVQEEWFDGVMICTGHHADKRMPSFDGQADFQGDILHSHDYKNHQGYENKRVVIVGIGNSSGDAAVELSRVASQVYVSTRRRTWVARRIGDNGLPTSILVANRFKQSLSRWFGPQRINDMVEKQANKRMDHQLYNLKPKHRFTAQHPMVNDELHCRIACGSIEIKPNVKKILKTGVEFEDGTIAKNIDIIMFATGYVIGFPFVDKKILDVKENRVEMYKYVFPPDIQSGTLAVIGCVQPIGSTISLAEMQCRWAARVIKGVSKLPACDIMWKDIREAQSAMAERYVQTPRHTIQVDWIPYMDDLAEQIGCKPNIGNTILSGDPKLAAQLYFGPCIPAQYRLVGPGKWGPARDTIMGVWDRVYKPFNSKPLISGGGNIPWAVVIFVSLLALMVKLFLL